MSLASIQFSRAFRTTEPDSERSMVVHASNAPVQRRRAALFSAPHVHNEMTHFAARPWCHSTVRCNRLLAAGTTLLL
jgi:hypothetical protein